MTQMSEPHVPTHIGFAHNRATPQGQSSLAHGVHDVRALVVRLLFLTSVASGGCVFPPDLSVGDQDAGVNSPPAILAVRSDQQELPPGETVTFEQGPTAGSINATLIDTDLADTLYVRAFVDYTVSVPTPARVNCTAPPPVPAAAQRSVMCDVTALCTPADLGTTRSMSVLVFDREPLESGQPSFQAMPPGGLKTSVFYFLKCIERE
jgi:hypothetical protein